MEYANVSMEWHVRYNHLTFMFWVRVVRLGHYKEPNRAVAWHNASNFTIRFCLLRRRCFRQSNHCFYMAKEREILFLFWVRQTHWFRLYESKTIILSPQLVRCVHILCFDSLLYSSSILFLQFTVSDVIYEPKNKLKTMKNQKSEPFSKIVLVFEKKDNTKYIFIFILNIIFYFYFSFLFVFSVTKLKRFQYISQRKKRDYKTYTFSRIFHTNIHWAEI